MSTVWLLVAMSMNQGSGYIDTWTLSKHTTQAQCTQAQIVENTKLGMREKTRQGTTVRLPTQCLKVETP